MKTFLTDKIEKFLPGFIPHFRIRAEIDQRLKLVRQKSVANRRIPNDFVRRRQKFPSRIPILKRRGAAETTILRGGRRGWVVERRVKEEEERKEERRKEGRKEERKEGRKERREGRMNE